MTLDEFLTLSLPERIRWLRTEGPKGRLSHDRFAALLGTSRQTAISWESGVEPKRYADALAEFSGFPRETFLRREAEAVAEESTLRLLRELRETLDESAEATARSLEALAAGIARIEERLPIADVRGRKARG